MKRFLFIAGLLFSITLAVVVGLRLSVDALAIIIGIVCGMLASVPPTLILFWVLRRQEREMKAHLGQSAVERYPPVVVVNGQAPNGYGSSPFSPALPAATPAPGFRDFKVVGQEKTETTGDILPPFWDQK